MDIKELNTTMTSNAVYATDQLCSDIKFVVLQTGSNVGSLRALVPVSY